MNIKTPSLITSYSWSQKQFPSLKMHFSWFGLPYRRKPLTTQDCRKRLQACLSTNG